ncbi:hypothetical protein HYFRA_00005341 [Hymenoscyphus fraxineus]|uniref:Uncharacterized protein n=1 Tax=Hymenoscyphus fraxineus TaxID=746836 RepID=A0A9N9PWB3_9HELO|nr:hypothetical protein HYFRA_00005341 [Hymenoscyphus fraxineus]
MCLFRPCRLLVLATVDYLIPKYEERKAVRQASVKTLSDGTERYVQDARQENLSDRAEGYVQDVRQETHAYELGAVEEARVRKDEGWTDVKDDGTEGPPPGYETAVGARAMV